MRRLFYFLQELGLFLVNYKKLFKLFADSYVPREWEVRNKKILYLLILLSLSSVQLAFHSQIRNLKGSDIVSKL